MKRLALYVFWEKDGIVRDYVTYYLNGLKEVAQDIVVIVNGKLSVEGRQKLEAQGVDILVRENTGLDFGAWKAALEYKGWDEIYSYDELILCNCSCYGPVYPFSEAFQRMEEKKCNFWGLTRHPETDVCIIPNDPNTKILSHIQSFFIVFRHKLLHSVHFHSWWKNLVATNNYNEEVGFHETKFTAYFEDAGYTSACLMDMDKYFEILPNENATLLYADRQIFEDRMPLVKRKMFVDSEFWWNSKCTCRISRDVLHILREHTSYPEEFIWQDLLATQKFSQVKDALHLSYILSSDKSSTLSSKPTTALLCFAYYPDLCDSMCHYISSMPNDAHICIISSREDTLEVYRTALSKFSFRSVEFRLKPNRGRDVSAYLVTGRDILLGYDLVCCIHDKKSKQLQYPILAEEFAYHCLECCLHSKEYVNNIIELFQKESFCGLLVPPTVYFGPFCTLGAETVHNEESMKKAYEMLSLSCPMDDTPVAPFGAYFWARKEGIRAMFRYDWKYEDFPDEPLPIDSTISHGIERIYPLAAQEEGYYTAWCSPDSYASLYMNNLSYMMREYNKRLYKLHSYQNWTTMKMLLDQDVVKKFAPVNTLQFSITKYWKYKILSKITFGKRRSSYKNKYRLMKVLRKSGK